VGFVTTAFTIWIIGYLFTCGMLINDESVSATELKKALACVLAVFIWPVILGMNWGDK
jgi:hypothetical protein